METTNTQAGNGIIKDKSEILFIYESIYSIPNGDPFTGEQRYDEETKKVLVSDVRIKRFIRDYLKSVGEEIYVVVDRSEVSKDGKESGAAARMKALKKKYPALLASEAAKKCIDVRLFGGISTEKGDSFNHTGPVQFALLNPSLNEVDLRMHQNTSVFPSQMKNEQMKDQQGSIGTTSVVPYSINQIHGWINPFSAKETGLSQSDVSLMFKSLWESINNANTRTKSNQNSLLLLQIIYSEPTKKIYGVDRLIKIKPKNDKRGEQLRSIDDFEFDFSKLIEVSNRSNDINKIFYYTDSNIIKEKFTNKNNKFEEMTFPESQQKINKEAEK